jgi:hypothetical protein
MSSPLIAAIVGGRSDIVGAFFGAMDSGSLQRLIGTGDAYICELQGAGLIRADLPASVIAYMLGALKMGMFNSPELHSREQLPTTEQLAEAFSDLIRRWLEPEPPPQMSEVGKQLLSRYFASVKESQ